MNIKEITVTVKVEAETPARAKDKIALLKKISDLPASDQQRVLELASNPKALEMLESNWETLKTLIPQ